MKKEREKNYEILRIVAMLMIVCLHYLSKGGALADPSGKLAPTGYTAWLIEAFCLVAVNVYVLISGYFGIGDESATSIEQTKITDVLKRPLCIWLQVFFYSVVIGVLFLVTGVQEFDIYTVFMYVFPISTEHYWFATSYILLTLLMPFINAGFDRLEKRSVQGVLACMLVLFSLAKTIIPMQLPWDHKGYDAFWFVFLYLTGAYLRRYGINRINSRAKSIALYVVSSLLIFASMLCIRTLYLETGSLKDFISYGYSYNFLFCYTAAIGLFLVFQRNPKTESANPCGSTLQLISGATFGVYLIHEHVNLRYLWPTLFNTAEYATAPVPTFILHMIGTVAVVYVVCTLIEILRKKLIKFF